MDFIEDLLGILTGLLLIGGLVAMGILAIRYRHAERLRLIEKGMHPDAMLPSGRQRRRRWALIILGLGLGVLFGSVLSGWLGAFAGYVVGVLGILGAALLVDFQLESETDADARDGEGAT